MLKQRLGARIIKISMQPPSGGCVLKLSALEQKFDYAEAAAFGRLCVETICLVAMTMLTAAAAFGRLCVETKCLK